MEHLSFVVNEPASDYFRQFLPLVEGWYTPIVISLSNLSTNSTSPSDYSLLLSTPVSTINCRTCVSRLACALARLRAVLEASRSPCRAAGPAGSTAFYSSA